MLPPSLLHRFHLTVFPKALAQKSPSQALRLGNPTSDRVKEGRPNSQLCCLHNNSSKHPFFPFPARPTCPFLSQPHLRDHLQEHPNCIWPSSITSDILYSNYSWTSLRHQFCHCPMKKFWKLAFEVFHESVNQPVCLYVCLSVGQAVYKYLLSPSYVPEPVQGIWNRHSPFT